MPVLRNFLKTLTPPAREHPGDWVQHPDYFVGKEALGKDDPVAATGFAWRTTSSLVFRRMSTNTGGLIP